MPHPILLIDFENVRNVSLASLPTDCHVLIFVGRSQHSIPFEVTRDAQQLGNRLEWIKIEGDGHNNLDFHLTFYLGQLSAKHRDAEFLILSRDKGFDAVLKHAAGLGLNCKRIESLTQARPADQKVEDPHFEKTFKVLSHLAKNSRPRKRKTLTAQVASVFQKKEPAAEVERIVNLFFSQKLVSEANNALTYNF